MLDTLKYAEDKGYSVCLVMHNGTSYFGEIEISPDSENLVIICDQGRISANIHDIKHSSTIVAAHF
ncbi:hypothetical protein PUW24_09775 [Paenibacillus urinalis]|uniref:Uncharacterized protein n=2 Tax=Paenibacillus TaxID=44249 RepID=A0AAX3N365_9BACL|nr:MULTISPECIES: hypothetical protein [Paenibacillus]OMC65493.1 hypothetical protein BK126_22615 [Paenibacillus sp. FSL H7-0326]WDH83062.1 hypothetical protein PUW23_02120 [Paenibacillus urinalis]WDH99136.1 hypothetical protein PUW24_09775 [Paenibacillus urinalis]WDI02826.1 hypothetical protein PUW25_02220 [Paenibacillus urinalis]SDX21022.1 hypothetical protein SAMN05518848_105218 [Paenibacillus sp. PDC88]